MQRLGQILIDQGKVSSDRVDFCLNVQKNNGRTPLGALLKHYHFVSDRDVVKALAKQWNIGYYDGEYHLHQEMLEILTYEFCKENSIYPLKGPEGPALVLIHLHDIKVMDHLKQLLGAHVPLYLGLEEECQKAISEIPLDDEVYEYQISDDPCLKKVNALLDSAVHLHASDIHLEPGVKVVHVRFRISGLLRFMFSFPIAHLPQWVNVLFHKANVTVGDFYHFHDARFEHWLEGRGVDVRLSHIPSAQGSSIVLRLLDKEKSSYSLDQLGYSPEQYAILNQSLIKPDGLTLIVGPTGCGKTTTLYAVLNSIKDLSKKIVTIEDPVEMPLPLSVQVQTQEERGINFAETVRALLRHDPDIMLIGEVRDNQTAEQAMRAAMTGHKVFATLHTTRAIDAIYRLINLGIDPFLISQALSLIIAQRLVRTLCVYCKEEQPIDFAQLAQAELKYFSGCEKSRFVAKGCKRCLDGYSGRTVLSEIISIDSQMQSVMIKQQWDQWDEIYDVKRSIRFIDDAKNKMASGITSVEELVRVIG